jgi:hypothetical protein
MLTMLAVAAALAAPAQARPIDNPWFPLPRGRTLVYHGVKDGKAAVDTETVTSRTKVIQGVPCVAVEDRLTLNGKLEELTTDWYTQDASGNVWYYGEATEELDPAGHVVSREGSWQAGVNGAHAGIFMPARPQVGSGGLQEYYKGHAEDHFRVLSLRTSVKTPYVSTSAAMLTKEWTPLEPKVLDHKYYVRGLGTVREESVKGPVETLTLVAVHNP